MIWRLEILCVDREEDDPRAFKQEFEDRDAEHDDAHEFLYMLDRTSAGHWMFGAVGRVNGALLWPDALEYSMDILNERMKGKTSV